MHLRRIFGKRTPLIVIILGLACVTCAAIPLSIMQHCNSLEEIPYVEVYPNSEITEQIVRKYGSRPMATIYYTANVSRADVFSYFSERLDCEVFANRNVMCRGNLENTPNQEYFIYFSYNDAVEENQTSYTVEIWWRRCFPIRV